MKLHMGRGRLMDRHTIEVAGQTITAEKILVATGGAPVVPTIPGREFAITSNEAFHLPELPKRIAIVGGGYIAVEFAGIFNGLGGHVDLVLRRDRVLRGFDEECRTAVHDALKDSGIKMRTEMQIGRIEATRSGERRPSRVHTPARRHVRDRSRDVRHRPRAQHRGHRAREGGRAARQGRRHRRRRMVQDDGAQHLGGGRRHRPHQPHARGDHGRPLLRRHRVRQQAAQARPSRRAVGRVLPARARQCRADGGGGQDAAGRGPCLHLRLPADEVHPVRPPAAHLHEADRRGRDRQGGGRAHGGRRCRRADPGPCGRREGGRHQGPVRRHRGHPSDGGRGVRHHAHGAGRAGAQTRSARPARRSSEDPPRRRRALAPPKPADWPFIHSTYRFTNPGGQRAAGVQEEGK